MDDQIRYAILDVVNEPNRTRYHVVAFIGDSKVPELLEVDGHPARYSSPARARSVIERVAGPGEILSVKPIKHRVKEYK